MTVQDSTGGKNRGDFSDLHANTTNYTNRKSNTPFYSHFVALVNWLGENSFWLFVLLMLMAAGALVFMAALWSMQ